jgi:recombinational DNA repair ATPase RecF
MYTKEDALQVLQKIDIEISKLQSDLDNIDQKVDEDLNGIMRKYNNKFTPERLEELKQNYRSELHQKSANAITTTLNKLKAIKSNLFNEIGSAP